MPPTIRANIQRKLRLSDRCIMRAIEHLADVHTTVNPQHADIGSSIETYMIFLDHIRQFHRAFYQLHWGETKSGLWDPGDLTRALADAIVILDPKHRTRKRS